MALDYRLDDPLSSGYKAGALAQLLRDSVMDTVAEDFPIILVSVTAHDLFDGYFSIYPLSTHSIEILSLVLGYKKIRDSARKT